MNSFIENVNYIAGLDNNYGDKVYLLKNNLILLNTKNDINLSFKYFDLKEISIKEITHSKSGMLYNELELVLQEFIDKINTVADIDAILTYELLDPVISFSIDATSTNPDVKINELNFNAKKTENDVELYNIYGKVENTLNLLPALAMLDKSVTDGFAVIGRHRDEILVVSDNINDVNIVSDSIDNVNTVCSNMSSILTVNDSINNVNITANNISNVNTVASDIDNVNTASDNIKEIIIVHDNISNVNNVSENMSNVKTVADNMFDIKKVNNNIDNVNIVAKDIDNVNTVGFNISDVVVVKNNLEDIITVAEDISNVNNVSSNIVNVNTIASNISDTNTTAVNISDIINVSENIDNIIIDANNIDSINTVASRISSVEAVAINIGNIEDVVNNTTNINTIADNISDINSIADNIIDIQNAEENALIAIEKADIATTKAQEASDSVSSILAIANTATAKATEASISASTAISKATEASNSATSALSSSNSANASASIATTKASEASVSAANASSSAVSAEASNQSAISARDTILAIELQSESFADDAETSKLLAEKWASEAEDVIVAGGKYSARHYALKAEDYAQTYLSLIDDSTPSLIKTYSSSNIESVFNSHSARVDNPHGVTKTQIGLGNAEDTADNVKNVLSATKLATARTIGGVSFDGTADIAIPFANLASKPTTLSGYGITDLTSHKGDNPIDTANTTVNAIGYATSINMFGQVNGGLINTAYSPEWQSQIAQDFRTGQIALRGKNSGTWTGWRTVLDSENYNSYSPSKTGTGASGTWGISITGNSATATHVSGGKATVHGTGNDYHQGGVEVVGNGPANTVFPTIGFHQPSLYASSLQLRGGGDFRFYRQGGGSYANVTANTFIGNLVGNADTATTATNVNGGYVSATTGNFSGDIVVGAGQNHSHIYMTDNDEGTRIIHCNSNRIGFLTQDGNWGAWCNDDGSFQTNVNMIAPTFYGNLQGNATTATTATNQTAGSGNTCDAKFKNTPAHGTSFSECNGQTDAPNTGWWLIYSIRHSNASNYWGTQIAYGWEDNANAIYQRNISGGTWSGWTRVDVSGANITEIINNAGYITSAGRAYPRRSDGADLNFHWSGQGGQPTWLWGGNDGANMYVYNPSNFSVNYANSAEYAGSVASASPTVSGGIKARLDGTTLYITTNGANA